MRRAVMSLWTETPFFRRERGPLLVATLAANCARRHFPETALVTDRAGAALAAHLDWPFGEISTALATSEFAECRHVWALGKLLTNSLQEHPFVQFDWDVILLKPLPEGLTRAAFLAQAPDYPECYLGRDMRAWMAAAGYPQGATAFNAGIVGGVDLPLLRDYAAAGIELAKRCASGANGTHLSMFAEQYHAGVFTARRGRQVATLLPMYSTREEVAAAGFVHLTGGAKRSPRWVARAEARLARDFPAAYTRFLEGWARIDRQPLA